jgi:polyhydroxyalkanoate synthesis repressor PhaR
MQIIKKYANRKLYHTNRKQYITLDGIARLVQSGEAVQILDNETGADITASILAQIVLHSRGQNIGPLPATVLTSLIQVGGDALAGLRRALFLSLGGIDLIEAEIVRRLDQLVAEGSLSPDEAKRMERLLLRPDLAQAIGGDMTMGNVEVPSRNDVARLHAQVDALTATVEQLFEQNAAMTIPYHNGPVGKESP